MFKVVPVAAATAAVGVVICRLVNRPFLSLSDSPTILFDRCYNVNGTLLPHEMHYTFSLPTGPP